MADLLEICKRYPQKNDIWLMLDTLFTTDASMVNGLDIKDPWNRPFPRSPTRVEDKEGDVLYWDYHTSVCGEPIVCRVFNT